MAIYPGEKAFSKSDMIRDVTSAMIYELDAATKNWVARGKVTSSGRFHAEEWFIRDIKGDNKLGISTGVGNNAPAIRMEITKSPCCNLFSGSNEDNHNCGGQLVELLESGRISSLHILYLGLYNTTSNEAKGDAQNSIGLITSGGVILDVWNWEQDPQTSDDQKKFLRDYRISFKNNSLGSGRWTDVDKRGDLARAPETASYAKFMATSYRK